MATHLIINDKAPEFEGRDGKGNKFSLSNIRGQKVVLFFYPADDTPSCTIQACNLRDNFELLKKNKFQVLGISPDEIESHQKFSSKFNLPFPLLTDPQHRIIKKYGVWGEKNLYGRKYMGLHRTTFIINEKGYIERIFLRPKNKTHAEEIISSYP
jgi:peroxiredoxin Q/BCP